MSPNPREFADLVKSTEENLNGKLHFLRSNALCTFLLQTCQPFKVNNINTRQEVTFICRNSSKQ